MRIFTRSGVRRCARLAPLALAALVLSGPPLHGREAPRERGDAKVREINKRLKREGAKWRAGNVSAVRPSAAESRKLFPPIPPIPEAVRAGVPVIRAAGTEAFPLAWDWREMNGVTPVKHQFRPYECDSCYEYCGSCYAFAACAQLESFIKIYDGRDENLSEQQILSCRNELNPPFGPGGCLGGDATLAYNTFLDPGAVAETCMVYAASDTIPCREHECAVHGRISGYSIVANDESSLKLALMSGPVWIDMYSCDDFKFFYTGGSYTYPPGVAGPPNHAMLCVGWNDTLTVCDSAGCETIGSWIVKNSWGTAWGYDGYGYIQYGTPTFAEDAGQIHYTRGPVARLHLREPDGGQVWAAGSRHKILWRSAGIEADRFEVGYVREGRSVLIDGGVDPLSSEYVWAPGDEAIGECAIVVAARGPGGELLGSDESDAPFSVIEPRVEWNAAGVAACGNPAAQTAPEALCDNLGGAIVVWLDARNGGLDVYAQRFNGAGSALWPSPGVCLGASSDYRSRVRAAADGFGGFFAVWENTSLYDAETATDIRAQHVSADGAPLAREARICSALEAQLRPQVAADGSGGAYVVWEDMRGGTADIYIERINALGGSVWETNLPVCAAAQAQTRPQIVEDGAGGVIVAWTDRRTGSEYIGAQRILPTGAPAWQTDGIPVCPAPGIVASCRLISDRRGGAVVAWLAQGSGGPEMRAQRILPDGRAAWDPAGVAVCPAALDPGNLAVAPDGCGGIIAAWDDRRGEWIGQVYHPVNDVDEVEYQRDIYAQRVTAGGRIAWAPGGVAVAALPRNQEAPRITYDGAGGAVVAWSDKRDSRWLDAGELNIPEDENNFDIFAQRIDSAGNALWRENGEPLCAEPAGQLNAALTADHGPGVFVAWEDASEAGPRVRAQKIAGSYSAHRCAVAATIGRNGASRDASGAVFSGCPGGDLDTLRVVCDFVDGDMADVPSVSPAEIELAAEGQGFLFCDPADAGTPGTPENGYTVTLIRSRLKGCGGCPGGGCALAGDPRQRLTLRYAGSVLGSVDGLRIRSVDARGDGSVTALTNDGMGPAFGRTSNDAAYRRCYDFDGSGRIDQNDLSCMASHYGHGGAAAAAVPPVRSALADVGLRFVVRRMDGGGGASKLSVTIMLENARGLSSLLLAFDNGSPRIAYRRWIPATYLRLRFPIATAVRDGRALLCVAGYGLRAIDSPSVEMCAFECDIAEGDTAAAGEISWADEAPLVFCEYVDAEGRVGSIAALAYEEAPAVIGNGLRACYPNPFNPKTTIAYSIAEHGPVTLRIYTVSGQLVKTLVNSSQAPRVSGYSVEWDGRNDEGSAVASGVYLYRLTARNFYETKKMVLLR